MKLKQTVLTSREWQESKKCPAPFRNKKRYYRKAKHKKSPTSGDFFCIKQKVFKIYDCN